MTKQTDSKGMPLNNMTGNNNYNNQNSGFPKDALPTPTRFLMESGSYNFTPGLLTSIVTNETNPFEASFGPNGMSQMRNNGGGGNARSISSSNAGNGSQQKTGNGSSSAPTSFNAAGTRRDTDSMSAGGSDLNNISGTSSRSNSNTSGLMPTAGANTNTNDELLELMSGRKRHDLSDEEDDEEGGEGGSGKRQKFLQKNRAAASKCRQKKKEWIQNLEKTADEVSKKNDELTQSVAQLREELMTLKSMLLAHRDCNCEMIQKYIHSSGQFSYLINEVNNNNNNSAARHRNHHH